MSAPGSGGEAWSGVSFSETDRSGAEGPEAERAVQSVPRIHLVTDSDILARADFVEVASALLLAGGRRIALHLRGHGGGGGTTTARRLHDLAGSLVPAAASSGALLVVNDRVDVAIATGAGGVQLGSGSLQASDLPEGSEGLRVGRSVHDVEEARAAGDADWLLVGTLYPTPSHPGHPGAGPELLARIGAVTRLPRIGIGGVTPERLPELEAAGSFGVAVRGGVWDAPDAAIALQRYLSAVHGTSDSDPSQRP